MTKRSPGRLLLPLLALTSIALPAGAQFFPYYGKNKVKYDNFAWRIYKSPHFEIYYYPEFEQHLERLASYAESAYRKVASDLKHEIAFTIPLILYKTHSEFEQTNLTQGFIPEAALAFTEPYRNRMVVPIDMPPDQLQGLITHELTHVFEFDLIPRSLVQRDVPLWVDEGLAEWTRGIWDPLDLMWIRDAAVTDQVPKMSRTNYQPLSGREAYNFGHACFEFIEARYGKEGIRQFLYTLRKGILGGSADDIYRQAFRTTPQEFDEAYDKWLKERFKPFRDKQRPSDYGKDLSPDSDETPYTQVFGVATTPSGELIAAITGNRADGEADIVLLSARDGRVIKNLTKGYTLKYEDMVINFSAMKMGRSIAIAPNGDTIAFFGRTGKRRSLVLASVLSGDVVRRIPLSVDEATGPALLPDGRHALFSALKDGVSDIFKLDLETGALENLTQDAFADADPQVSPDGTLVVYSRRVSAHEKLYVFPLADPGQKTQLTFGTFNDVTPIFSADGKHVYYASDEDDGIYNVRSLDLETGAIAQYTDVLGGNMTPAPLSGRTGERLAFVSFFKGEFRLASKDLQEPVKEVDQRVETARAEILDFQPDLVHQVVPENKRRKKLFEKLYLEGRPPINIAVSSGGEFFGGSAVALSDVLGDKNFVLTAYSLREFRNYEFDYLNLSGRFQYGLQLFDNTRFFYPNYFIPGTTFDRDGAFATQRFTGGTLIGQYPLDKFRRLQVSAGVMNLRERYENPAVAAFVCASTVCTPDGVPYFFNNGIFAPVGASLVQETTRFANFGPLDGSTFALSAQVGFGEIQRYTFEADLRKYFRLGSTSSVFALRARGFKSFGDDPAVFYFGGNQELRGFPYLSFSGNEGFFANVELRIPLINVAATPIGLVGPLRGTAFFGIGGAKYKGQPYQFSTSDDGRSYLDDPVFGTPVSGFRLVDGRASFGVGLQFFFLGYPMHFDWSKLTDLQVVADDTRFDFWIGFDF
jgi:Tol biopolymer transport system component